MQRWWEPVELLYSPHCHKCSHCFELLIDGVKTKLHRLLFFFFFLSLPDMWCQISVIMLLSYFPFVLLAQSRTVRLCNLLSTTHLQISKWWFWFISVVREETEVELGSVVTFCKWNTNSNWASAVCFHVAVCGSNDFFWLKSLFHVVCCTAALCDGTLALEQR